MVTVIADKEELPTPVNNGVTAGSNDNERPFQYIKDYQEVDFHRSSSCKPLPQEFINGGTEKSSINGTFFVQVDFIELLNQYSNNNNHTEQTPVNSSLLLTLTDGITTVQGITIDSIPDLNFNVRPGCKLLLTGVISIENGFLQLTHDNTRFQYGSNTYSRPRSTYRGRGGGSYRPSYEGRRGGGGNSNSRYDNDDNESNFLKQPPKTTLMDFMTSLKISNDSKPPNDNENQKVKDRSETKRRNPEQQQQYYSNNKTNNGLHNTTNNSNYYYPPNNYSDQITFQQDGINDQLDPEDDPSHAGYRERRNPLPPRLQRAQEERTRRNTGRYFDDTVPSTGNESNGHYRNGTTNNHSLSSSSSYSRRGDQGSFIPNNSSMGQPHATQLNSYPPHANMIATVNGSTPAHLAYFPTNPVYSLAGIPSPPFHPNPNGHLACCYGPPYGAPTYLPPSATNGFNGESKTYTNNNNNHHPTAIQTNSTGDETEGKTVNESPQDENNESENKSHSSSSSSSASSNDGSTNAQQGTTESQDEKRRDSNPNSRPRWRVGDICLARWSEDREFYVATIVQIHPPSCTVLFRDYNNYDQVHFSDLKILPRDQQYYSYIPPMAATPSDLNVLAASAYYPPRPNYYPQTIDGCLIMPEVPPFPFNSAGTLYMCPTVVPPLSRSSRTPSFQQSTRRNENGNSNVNIDTTINSSSTPSKDSNDTSIIDSTTISIDDNQQNLSCSVADIPSNLVTKDEEREHSTSTESLTSSKFEEQQQEQDEKQENDSVLPDN